MTVQIVLLTLFTFAAGMVGTISGFGISTIMIPVMSLYYPLPGVLLFVAIIHFFGDIWKIIFFKKGADWKLIAAFGIPGILMSYAGASITLAVSPMLLKRLLGTFLVLYVITLFVKHNWKVPRTNGTAAAGGAMSGFFSGVFGIGGAVRSAFLSAYDLPKEMFIFTGGVIAFFIDIARITRYISGGMTLQNELIRVLLILIPASLAGAYTARKTVDFIPQNLFRLIIAVFLGLAGIGFLIWP